MLAMPCDQPRLRHSPQWHCITGCGACCRLDPTLRGEALDALNPEQRERYLAMVGPDGWCIHFDTGRRSCRIYADRPDFCQVANLVQLFGPAELGSDAGDHFAIDCCKQQIRSEYGGRGKVMRRFLRAIRGR
jgi:Fe-S-cluster containining protein